MIGLIIHSEQGRTGSKLYTAAHMAMWTAQVQSKSCVALAGIDETVPESPPCCNKEMLCVSLEFSPTRLAKHAATPTFKPQSDAKSATS